MNETKTNWDDIVSGENLNKAKIERGKTFIIKRERRISLPELESEGWEQCGTYKNGKDIKVKKAKSIGEQFENYIWLLFFRLGFIHMNYDRHFRMSYDYNNPDLTQQIDVFAADEETIIIVECKTADRMKEMDFKKDIEALHGQMQGLRREAQSKYPKAKVKFIWATQNCIISRPDKARLKEWDIVHFDDNTIQYYDELAKHLGTSARYQLLGDLFANQEIRNMENRVPAIKGKMGDHEYYSFSIEPDRLLKIGYVLHRNGTNKDSMKTYQRIIKKTRLNNVRKFIEDGGFFPNSIIVGIETRGKGLNFDLSSNKVEGSISQIGILHLPKKYRSAYIIDGQHRLYGYSDSKYAKRNSVPVIAFVDLDPEKQLELFMQINENQKAIPKSLRVTLNGDMLWDSPDYNKRRKALRSRVAQKLGEEDTSPLNGHILIGEEEKTNIKCITVDPIQEALAKCKFLAKYRKHDCIDDGTFDVGEDLQQTMDLLYPFIEECLKYIKNGAPEEWNRGSTGILTINRGIQAVILVLNDIVNMLKKREVINPKVQKTRDLLKSVTPYLDPLNEYLRNITDQDRKDLKGHRGSTGSNRFLRIFQREIANKCSDFQPNGLDEYWADEDKIYNIDSQRYLEEIKIKLKELIKSKLYELYDEDWDIQGIKEEIYKRIRTQADDQNYNNRKLKENKPEVTGWDFITFDDCRKIVTYSNHWTSLFSRFLTRPEDAQQKGTKTSKTEWIEQLQNLQSSLGKEEYGVSHKDFEFIESVYEWLETVQLN